MGAFANHSRTPRLPGCVFAAIVLCAFAAPVPGNADGRPAWARERCAGRPCILVEHGAKRAMEARLLAETLRLRLCANGVTLLLGALDPALGGPPAEEALPKQALAESACVDPAREPVGDAWWIVRLTPAPEGQIRLVVDHLGDESEDDMTREVAAGKEPMETVWTLALTVEEAVLPYLRSDRELAPVGAGLALSEPRQVGGVKKSEEAKAVRYPKLRWIGAGLDLQYAGAVTDTVDDLLLGPKVTLAGLLAPRVLALIGIGWAGNARFHQRTGQVEGTISYVPLDILFGYVVFLNSFADLSVLGGVSTGFSIIQSASTALESQRTDLYFTPWIEVRFDAAIYIYGPLAIYLRIGAAVPIIRDVLKNAGITVYEQDWIMPLGGVGVQLWL